MTDLARASIEHAERERDAGLARAIGPMAFAATIVNAVIGGGIFVLPAAMAAAMGTKAWLAYLICAIAIGAVVACFAEAGSRVPTSGGPYGYVGAAFGPLAGFVAGVLLWLSCVLASGGIAAALADMAGAAAPVLAAPLPRASLIAAIFGALALVNLVGARPAARMISIATAVKLVPILLFLVIGATAITTGRLTAAPAGAPGDIGRALILGIFAFSGMETSLSASGEVADPARNVPRGLFMAMGFVLVSYVAIQFVAQGLLGLDLATSKAPLADGIAVVVPGLRPLLLGGAAVSLLFWLASDLLGAPRVLFAFARDGYLPAALGRVHRRWRTPHVAIVTHAALAAICAISGGFVQLAVLATLTGAALYISGCAASWMLRRRDVGVAGAPIRVPGLPLIAAIGIVAMIGLIAVARPIEIAGLAGSIIASVALYYGSRAFAKPAQQSS